MRIRKGGFTIIELMVVIVVIAILASITLVAYNNAQGNARDDRRRSDLSNIADAISLYHTKYGNDLQVGSGCGSSGNGDGWFNYEDGGTYLKSDFHCLTDAGYLEPSNILVDPFNCTTTTGSSAPYAGPCKRTGYAYMKYSSGIGDTALTCVYARLEVGGDASQLTSGSSPCASASSSTVATTYGMNYMVKVQQ
jgi:prepilin-type N-terminal cleavage/methylation domain-containing protein